MSENNVTDITARIAAANLGSIEFDQFVNITPGIHFQLRGKMKKAFHSDQAGPELWALITESPENHIRPDVKAKLIAHWEKNFNH